MLNDQYSVVISRDNELIHLIVDQTTDCGLITDHGLIHRLWIDSNIVDKSKDCRLILRL